MKLTDLELEEIEEIADALFEGEESGSVAREDTIIQWSISLEIHS